ncbi:MAG: hypothetical protein DRI61_01495 [Chloroflexi bacterium]|nr:MAG: hypothetical protein DRI61_01495 [Chloroflexota bacterium]
MPIVAIPDVLQEQLGTKAATALVDMMNQALEEQQRIVLTLAEDRFERRFSEELSKIREELALMRAEFREQLAALGAELRQEMASQMAELRQEMTSQMAELRQEMSSQVAELRQEMSSQVAELRQEMATQGAELRQEMASMQSRLHAEIAKRHSELIRWMFIFWIGQFISIAALVITLAQLLR